VTHFGYRVKSKSALLQWGEAKFNFNATIIRSKNVVIFQISISPKFQPYDSTIQTLDDVVVLGLALES
jgi:hypothetical protein